MKYLVVERWEEFQHYKDRAPLWIKNYTRLLHDDAYLGLSGHRRAILHGLWLVYASSSCQLLFDHGSLSRRLHLRVTSDDLKALRKAGFIGVSASKALAERSQPDIPEKEKEKDEEPRGHNAGALYRVQGAILACLPRWVLVQPWVPSAWRKQVGLPGNASKEAVRSWAITVVSPQGVTEWPQDACDAYCIALATRTALHREEAA